MNKIDNKNVSKTTNRIAIISSLIALSIAILTILHSDNKILGLEIIHGSFVEILVNFLKLALWFSVISGTAFLITTGYFNGFNYGENYKTDVKLVQKLVSKWHSFIKWLNIKSFNSTIGIFSYSFISIVFNIIAKLLGFYGTGSIIIATIITGIVIITIVILVAISKHTKIHKKS